jgi:hypothetical protein
LPMIDQSYEGRFSILGTRWEHGWSMGGDLVLEKGLGAVGQSVIGMPQTRT